MIDKYLFDKCTQKDIVVSGVPAGKGKMMRGVKRDKEAKADFV